MWTEHHMVVARGRQRRRGARVRDGLWTVVLIGFRSGSGHSGGIRSAVPCSLPCFPHNRRSLLTGQPHQYGLLPRQLLRRHRIRGLREDVRDLARVLAVDLTGRQRAPHHRQHRRRLSDARPGFLPGDPQGPHQHRLSAAETLAHSHATLVDLADQRQHSRIRPAQFLFYGVKPTGQLVLGKLPPCCLLCVFHASTVPRTPVRIITRTGKFSALVKCTETL